VAIRAALVFCLLSLLLVVAGGGTVFIGRLVTRLNSRRKKRLKKISAFHMVWQRAGMRFKLKALVGLYQCFAAVPSVFDVVAPPGLEEFDW
jgi:hypothetical protein